MEAMDKGEKKKRMPPKSVQSSIQYDLFGQFITNDVQEVSNTVEIWERIPKYFSAQLMIKNFTSEGLAQPYEWEYQEKDERGRLHDCKVVVQPALIKQENGKYKAFFPSKTEEAIEEALKKLLANQRYGLHDVPKSETWVKFSLSMLYKELKDRGCSRSRPEIKQSIEVMSKCNIAVFRSNKEVWNGSILQDLVTVGRDEYLEDADSLHIGRLPVFITRGIDRLQYRQFNYDRLMRCKEQLSRWIYKRLIHRYRHANPMNDYHFTYSSLKASGLLQQSEEYNNRKKVISALNELIEQGVIYRFEDDVIEQEGRKIIDIKYMLFPSTDFISEQKAANKRIRDQNLTALNHGWSLVDNQ